jgi:hypothetical protein
MLIATASMLGTREMLDLALTSKPIYKALAPEIGRRRVADIAACFGQQIALETRDIAATLAGGTGAADLRNLSVNLLARGRHAQAEGAARAAIEARPGQSLNHEQLAKVLLQAGRPHEAIAVAESTVPPELGGLQCSLLLARAHLLADDPVKARAHLPSSNASPYEIALLGMMIEHSLGRRAALTARVDTALHLASRGVFVRPSLMAEAYAWIGDAANALLWIERAASFWWDREILRVALSPFAAPLARDPAWQLLRKAAQRTLDEHEAPVPAALVQCAADSEREPITS